MTTPQYFASASEFRAWLESHHDSATELVVGFYRVDSGRPHMTWTEAVREALCYGWIDGLVKSIDDTRYSRRFTPRRPRSIWSAVNIRHVQELLAQTRMHAAGIAAFEARTERRSGIYSFEQRSVDLPEPFGTMVQSNRAAAAFWNAQPKAYRKAAAWWVVSAKQDATRLRRAQLLVTHSERGERVPQFVSNTRTSTHGKRGTPT